ncbi:fimbrial biogenesis outer membrane usher protein [Pseudomonas sp. TNT2022 ID681]|uniref:Fimbrial biogenesis outer membrane usher protein n=1 Tax=Pseudomonas fontis TaxID=2942633 RepID=A0ABT5NUC7_9PSED|nr:fimbria/pilus outer membrane usher protein [Pseudomonas fontis]MDD0977345.1 fimbrial biogenesis outer membrane usher protein [Pseudomonas fontis]MDD0991713.1 fimbrial biogenesis outer membrane usher protein [Pseudomonas fontis]
MQFQPSFMRQLDNHASDAGALALQALSSNDLAPGRYRVTIEVNRTFFDLREIEFTDDGQGELVPCLSLAFIEEIGVKVAALLAPPALTDTCIDLADLLPDARATLDASQLLLSVSIPQFAMRRDVAGYVDPQRWDYGINAAFINYQLGAQQGHNDHSGANNSQYAYINSGLNLGPWRLRSSNAFSSDSQGRRAWSRAYTYVQRDLPDARSQLTLGETFTPGDVFRSVPIKGVQIASDMSMLPDSMQSYAPVVRGVAMSRAKLEIRQNGFAIYTTYVSAGPYEINDLTTAAGSGELEIILTEADGQVRRFTLAYSSLNNLLREGVWRYSASAGLYNAPSYTSDNTMLYQGTLARGVGWNSTLYGGLMANGFYQAGILGIGRNLGDFGALALDATRSHADVSVAGRQYRVQGMSYALKYGKAFETRTSLRFAGYRYSTEGYRDFAEAVRERDTHHRFVGNRRSLLEASVFQDIGSQSSLSLTLSQADYWRTDYQQRQFQLNFTSRFKTVSYSVYASQSLNDHYASDRQFGLSVSVPLSFGRGTTTTYDLQENRGNYSQRASLSGRAADDRLSYRASLANSESQQTSSELSVGYQAPFASMGAGITQSSSYNSLSLNASGALLLHGDGIALGPYLGDTSGLAHVPGIADVGVVNAASARTNNHGYALIPYLQPYRVNRVMLNLDQLDPTVEIDNGITNVVPRRGAVIKASFPARRVHRLLLTIRDEHGNPLPFGAQVKDIEGTDLGIVGQAGQALLGVSDGPHALNVRWGVANADQCLMQLDTQQMPLVQGYRVQSLICR